MKLKFADLISPVGTIARAEYVFWGVVLFAIKYNIDRLIAYQLFHRKWRVWEYLFPIQVDLSPQQNWNFLIALLIAALPFVWSGCVLTIKRLRASGLPVWLVVLFFVPIVNLFFFAIIALLPEKQIRVRTTNASSSVANLIPRSRAGSALSALALNALSALVFTRFSVETLNQYGWGLFVGLPFCLGLTSSLIYSYHQYRKWTECMVVALLSISIAGLILLILAFEGIICLIMAAPILAVLAIIGATLGYWLQFQREAAPKLYCLSNVMLFAIMMIQAIEHPQPTLFTETSSIEIDAPPQTVWDHVVSFSELPPPREWIFKTGIAYPIRAEIQGRGAGAVRYCVFSTGSFVEPITVWDEPRLLRFGVLKNPPPMQEWTFYQDIHPPHLDGFFLSQQGQFRLKSISGNRTVLEGTTWYYHNLWPESYWRFWSDTIIHNIHLRVLKHIKSTAESQRNDARFEMRDARQ
ncbi:SRPBCC family protein [bacterium]|nr:SRPBCC family protein [bacterium]